MKTCTQCRALDFPRIERNEEGELVTIHHVRPEIQYLKEGEQLTEKQRKRGWTQRIFQGRQAIERDICTDCLNSNYIRRQLNADHRKKALQLEQEEQGQDNIYYILTDVDGCY